MKTMILVNPKAREGQVGDQWPRLQAQLMGALGEGEARVEFTSAVDHGSGMVRKALKEGIERVLVVGGDGTVSEAIQGFFENGKPVAPHTALMIMPAGRGDDFFKSVVGHRIFSSKEAWKQGLELLKRGKPAPVDIGRLGWIPQQGGASADGVHDRAFVNIASFGYPGLVVQKVHSHAGVWGRSKAGRSAWAYVAQSAAALMEYKPIHTQVVVDSKTVFDGPLFSGFILNGKYNAGGVCWNRDASIDDGEFHLVVVEPRDLLSTLKTGARLITGDWRDVKGVHLFQGKKIEVRSRQTTKREFPLFEIDGDQPEGAGTQGAVFECMPGAIQLWKA